MSTVTLIITLAALAALLAGAGAAAVAVAGVVEALRPGGSGGGPARRPAGRRGASSARRRSRGAPRWLEQLQQRAQRAAWRWLRRRGGWLAYHAGSAAHAIGAWLRGQVRRLRGAGAAAEAGEPGPAVEAFLAGASVREAAYQHQHTDPALVTAPHYRAAVRQAEAAIRAYVDELAYAPPPGAEADEDDDLSFQPLAGWQAPDDETAPARRSRRRRR